MQPTLILALLFVAANAMCAAHPPIALHPENPHYFIWRNKPAVLITSGEHYGAIINSDFDFAKYFKTLKSQQMNMTRVFTGSYVEPSGAFNIASNSMAPGPGKFIAPWLRSGEPGYPNGGNRFDLSKWNPAYFTRLHDFMRSARDHGVVVEMNLFCPFYEEPQWNLSPMNAKNNVNGVGTVARTNVYTLDRSEGLLMVQDTLVRKLVNELNEYDNLYYEICNEPYFGGVTLEWQHHIADVISKTERVLGNRHLISRNVANGHAKVTNPHPALSIFNFHYASPPVTVAENYGLNKVIGLNETGFKGTNDAYYRMEAWEFMLAGGALYNNLDYSFVVGHEKGDFVYPKTQPGGGTRELRRQLATLRDFLMSLDFIHMKPDVTWVASPLPPKTRVHGLAQDGRQYGAYFFSGTNAAPKNLTLTLALPAGDYRVEWLDVVSGKTAGSSRIKSTGSAEVVSPEYTGEIALRIQR
jgi:hypothetical protein